MRVGVGVGLSVVAGVFFVGAVFANAAFVVDRNLDLVESAGSRFLGRAITIGRVRGDVWPIVDVDIADVSVASTVPGAPPLVLLRSLHLSFDWRAALATRGHALLLNRVEVDGLVLHVRRLRDGSLDIDEVIRRLPPLLARDVDGLVVGSVTVSDSALFFADEGDGVGVVAIDEVSFVTGRVELAAPFEVRGRARVGRGGPPAAFALAVERVPGDLVFWPPPAAHLHVELPQSDLVRSLAFLRLPALFAAGVVDIAVDIDTTFEAISGHIDVDGAGLSAVVDVGAGAGAEDHGETGVARLAADVSVATADFRTAITDLDFVGAGLAISGNGVFADGSFAGLEFADVVASADELARLGLLVPALRATAPGALHLTGAGTARLVATPDVFDLDVNLGGARVVIGQVLNKRADQALRAHWRGERAARAAGSSPGRVDGPVAIALPRGVLLNGRLALQPSAVDVFFFDLLSEPASLASVASLSPVVHDVVDGSVRAGSMRARVIGNMGRDEDNFDFGLDVFGLDVVVDRNRVVGAARVDLHATTDVAGLRLQVRARLNDLALATTNAKGDVVVEKQAGVPASLRASLVEVGGRGSLGAALDRLDVAGADGGILFVGDGISPRWRRFGLGFSGRGSLRVGSAVVYRAQLSQIGVELSLRQGRLRFDVAHVDVFGGHADLSGSFVSLTPQPPEWSLFVDVDDLALADVLRPLHVITGDVSGRASVEATLRGRGFFLESVLTTLDGPVVIETDDVRIASVDAASAFIDQVWGVLAAIPGVSADEVARTRGPPLASALRHGRFEWGIHGEGLRIDAPTLTSFGLLTLSGHAGFDGALDLRAHLDLDGVSTPIDLVVSGTLALPSLSLTGINEQVVGALAQWNAWRCAIATALGDRCTTGSEP